MHTNVENAKLLHYCALCIHPASEKQTTWSNIEHDSSHQQPCKWQTAGLLTHGLTDSQTNATKFNALFLANMASGTVNKSN